MAESLLRAPDAVQAHTEGLALETTGRDEAALGNYSTAREHYHAADEQFHLAIGHLRAWEHSESTDGRVQLAHILNDRGFTRTREGVIGYNPMPFQLARQFLRASLVTTSRLVSGTETPHFVQEGKHGTPKLQRRALFTRHVSTLDLLSRNALAAEVIYDEMPDGNKPEWDELMELISADHLHGWGYQLGDSSIDGDVRTSNSANNARQEMAHGRRLHAGVALGRAALSLGATIIRNPGKTVAAAGSIYHRLPALISPAAARQSVRLRP